MMRGPHDPTSGGGKSPREGVKNLHIHASRTLDLLQRGSPRCWLGPQAPESPPLLVFLRPRVAERGTWSFDRAGRGNIYAVKLILMHSWKLAGSLGA